MLRRAASLALGVIGAVAVWFFARHRTDAPTAMAAAFALCAGIGSRWAVSFAWRAGAVAARVALASIALVACAATIWFLIFIGP